MAYIDLKFGEIDTSVVYVSAKELLEDTGLAKNTLRRYVITDKVDAYRFRNRTYYHPDAAEKIKTLIKCGLLG